LTTTFDISWGFFTLLAWGGADYLARTSSVRTGSLNTAFFVQAIGWVLPALYLGISLAISGTDRDIDWPTLARLVPLTAVLLGVGYSIHYRGLEVGSVSVVSAVTSAWLLISVLLAALFLDEAVTSLQCELILVVTAGIVLLSLQRGVIHGNGTGFWYGAGAMAFFGTAFVLWKPLTEAGGPFLAVVLVRLLSSIVALGLVRLRKMPIIWPDGSTSWMLLGAAALDALGYITLNVGLDRSSLTITAPLAVAHPLGTIALAWWLLRERPSRAQAAGMTIVIAGVIALSAIAEV
jgi:drug/metabolite transporter (DMT)-like permease